MGCQTHMSAGPPLRLTSFHRRPGGPLRIAILCSAHGFGHLTRQLAIVRRLQAAGARPEIFTAAPASVVTESVGAIPIHPWAIDVGLAQHDSLSEDLERTLALLEERCSDDAIDRLAGALRPFDRALVDIPPPGLEACRRAGIPALAVGNFDWVWTYRHYPQLQEWAERFARWQAPHPAAQLLPGPPLEGFAHVETIGLIGRQRPAKRLTKRGVLVSFGGFGLDRIQRLLPEIPGVAWITSSPMPPLDRADAIHVQDTPYPALVAGADAIFTKPGYGIFAESGLAGVPLVYVPRGHFPEAPWLEQAMDQRGDVRLEASLDEPARFRQALRHALEKIWLQPRRQPTRQGAIDRIIAGLLRT